MNISKILQASALSLILVGLVAACGPGTRESSKRPSMRTKPTVTKPDAAADALAEARKKGTVQEQAQLALADRALSLSITNISVNDDQVTVDLNSESVELSKQENDKKLIPLDSGKAYYQGELSNGNTMALRINESTETQDELLLVVGKGEKVAAQVKASIETLTRVSVAGLDTEGLTADEKTAAEKIQAQLTANVEDKMITITADSKKVERRIIKSEDKKFLILISKDTANKVIEVAGLGSDTKALKSSSITNQDEIKLDLSLGNSMQATINVTVTTPPTAASPSAPAPAPAAPAPAPDTAEVFKRVNPIAKPVVLPAPTLVDIGISEVQMPTLAPIELDPATAQPAAAPVAP